MATAEATGGTGSIEWSAWIRVGLGVLAATSAGLGLIMVIVAGFALPFDAIRTVGQASRIRHDWAGLLPAAVDGAMSDAWHELRLPATQTSQTCSRASQGPALLSYPGAVA